MRALGWFLATIFATLVAAAVLAWPLWQILHPLGFDWPFHRIASRSWQLLLLAGLLITLRHLGLRGRADWGYGLPRRDFLSQLGTGLAIGIATMLPITLMMIALGLRELEDGLTTTVLAGAVLEGALIGVAVAFVEETFFRGLMFQAISRESGLALATWATAILYSAVHFLGSARIPAHEVAWDSGARLLAGALSNFAHPAAVFDSFAALVLVGLLLALVRARTGAIAAGIGLHMGWVTVIKATTDVSRAVDGSGWSFLVGSLDGYTGWLVAAWAALLLAVAWRAGWLRPKPR